MIDRVCNNCGFREHLEVQVIERSDFYKTIYRVVCRYCGWQKEIAGKDCDTVEMILRHAW